MRNTLSALIALACLSVGYAGLDQEVLTVTSTNATETFTASKEIRGKIDTIIIDVVSAGTTGAISVTASPWYSTISDVTLVTSADHATDTTYRPRFDGTDTAGAALTGDPPGKYASLGDVILTVTNSSSVGAQYRAVIIYEK